MAAVGTRYEPDLDTTFDLVPVVGLKIMNQNLGIPNDILGRCCVMLPMKRLVLGHEKVTCTLDLQFGPGSITFTMDFLEDDPEEAALKLKKTLEKVTGGLSNIFSSKRLHEKLEVEDQQEGLVKRLVSVIAHGELNLEELFERHGTGGGKGPNATKVALNVATLRTVLDAWGSEHGSLGLGRQLPPRWLNPLAFTDAAPHPDAAKRAAARADGGGGGGEDEFGGEGDDEFGGDGEDEWGGDDGGAGGDDGGGEGEEEEFDEDDPDAPPPMDEVVGCSVEPVKRGIALETFADAVGRFSLKNGEMCAQLNHARETALFMDFEEKPDEFLELFHAMDDDSTGFISKAELTDGLIDNGMSWLLGHPYVAVRVFACCFCATCCFCVGAHDRDVRVHVFPFLGGGGGGGCVALMGCDCHPVVLCPIPTTPAFLARWIWTPMERSPLPSSRTGWTRSKPSAKTRAISGCARTN